MFCSLRWLVVVGIAFMMATGCRGSRVRGVAPASLSLEPASVHFPETYLGTSSTKSIDIINSGNVAADVSVSSAPPFFVSVEHIKVAAGSRAHVEIRFTPMAEGDFVSKLTIDTLTLPLDGKAIVVPQCEAAPVCQRSSFDFDLKQCVFKPDEKQITCTTQCVVGACESGECRGVTKNCDDNNACTIDACNDASGCFHVLRECPKTSQPCMTARCDPKMGCVQEPLPDGAACGKDDCISATVDICLFGQCVNKPRVETRRCRSRWMPTSLPPREEHAMTYDSVRRRTVLFGGGNGLSSLADTWEWDGTNWFEHVPPTSPPGRSGAAMVYDPFRARSLLFGGATQRFTNDYLADLWAWDGTAWSLIDNNGTFPPARRDHAMAHDELRQRLVLFGGWNGNDDMGDTWEWDGAMWKEMKPTHAPSKRSGASMAYDRTRGRVILFGGNDRHAGVFFSETWEWDGSEWALRTSSNVPPARRDAPLVYDALNRRMVLLGGNDLFGTGWNLWVWNGTEWNPLAVSLPAVDPKGTPAVYDDSRGRIVYLDDHASTWEYDGQSWTRRGEEIWPGQHYDGAVVYDRGREVVVLFGGAGQLEAGNETWEWSRGKWSQRFPLTSPPVLREPAMAFDEARGTTLLFGGLTGGLGTGEEEELLNQTWLWDGNNWTRAMPSQSPPARWIHSMAYDYANQRVVLFGGSTLYESKSMSDTWAWNGSTWEQTLSTGPVGSTVCSMMYAAAQNRVLLGCNTYPGETSIWKLDATAWTELSSSADPRISPYSVGYDPMTQRIVAMDWVNPKTWEWDGAAWSQMFLRVQPRGGGPMVYNSSINRLMRYDGEVLWVLLR